MSAPAWLALAGTLLVAGWAQAQPADLPSPALPALKPAQPGAMAQVLGRTERLLVVLPAEGDSLLALAERFLGRADRAWWLADAGGLTPGQPLVVPLVHPNPTGFGSDGYQTVPVLSYHRFGPASSAMVVTPAQFEAQLQALSEPGMHVLRLADLAGFLAGREPLPARSVVITVDDGHESFYLHAFPLLQKHRLPATLFVHTGAVGSPEYMSWAQIQEVAASGLVSVQAHSQTHQNLAARAPRETDLAYRRRLELEVQTSRRQIEQRLPGATVNHFAYPFGDASPGLMDTLARNAFELGLSARAGGNAFFRPPYLLQRTLVLGDYTLEDFRGRLQTRQTLAR